MVYWLLVLARAGSKLSHITSWGEEHEGKADGKGGSMHFPAKFKTPAEKDLSMGESLSTQCT